MNAGRMVGLSFLLTLTACAGGGSDGTDGERADATAVDGSGAGSGDPSTDSLVAEPGVDTGERLDDASETSPFADLEGDTAEEGPDGLVPASEVGGELLGAGPLRIVLTWARRPNDLDAHLTGPDADGQERFHVFSGDRDAGIARLSEDATRGAGPETIELDRPGSGTYRYSVFNFSGDADRPLGRSGARVEVFSGDASVADFAVPEGAGDLWTVFDIDDGRAVVVNTLSRLRTVEDYFPSRRRDPAVGSVGASDAAPLGADGYR